MSSLDRINLRLSPQTFDAIDVARNGRPGSVSRNTWIAEAIEEKLAREALPLASIEVKQAANA
ncbi:hypothetical protein [Agrobacterium vitis]|uniref:hypothetical protein n=1 Tax=Agrobacterium vitis TaxID=373 RepID=UPI001F2ADD85|nr:hypothetical protein [Agrobacterium vitis]